MESFFLFWGELLQRRFSSGACGRPQREPPPPTPIAFRVVEITEREALPSSSYVEGSGGYRRFGRRGWAGSWLGSKIVQQGAQAISPWRAGF